MRQARWGPKHSVKMSHCASVHIPCSPGCPIPPMRAGDPTLGWVPPARTAWRGGSAAIRDEPRILLAETLDRDPHRVASLEEARRLEAHRDPGRCAGRDHVAGHQRHEMADIADDVLDAEDQIGGVAVLAALAIDVGRYLELSRIA